MSAKKICKDDSIEDGSGEIQIEINESGESNEPAKLHQSNQTKSKYDTKEFRGWLEHHHANVEKTLQIVDTVDRILQNHELLIKFLKNVSVLYPNVHDQYQKFVKNVDEVEIAGTQAIIQGDFYPMIHPSRNPIEAVIFFPISIRYKKVWVTSTNQLIIEKVHEDKTIHLVMNFDRFVKMFGEC